jgi:hypothetical protein
MFPIPFHGGRIDQRHCLSETGFAAFADAMIRKSPGARLQSGQLRAAYLAWSSRAGAADLSFKQLRRLMERAGYRHLKSGRMCFADVELVEPEHFDLARGVPAAAAAEADKALMHRIDRVLSNVTALRDEMLIRMGVTQ